MVASNQTNNNKKRDMNTIKKIVLTGGPCAGKTTALVKVIEHFTSLGYKVFTIPEVPTMFTQSGMNYLTKNEKFFFEGEKATFLTQIGLEDSFSRMAETLDQPVIIVCDRGAMDISTYLSVDFWNRIISEQGYSNTQLRERYDAVLHLVSAADGAEQFYTTANNAQRLEKADEAGLRIARELDKKIVSAWKGHPHLRVINNHEDFENKLNRVLKEISNVLGIPQPIEEERKYIVKLVGEVPNAIDSDIVQTYLSGEPGSEIRLRRRSFEGGKYVYVHTSKKRISDKEQIETERQINANLYESMLQQADPYRATIRKHRKSFIWKGQYFELDSFEQPVHDLMILETKGIGQHENVNFPPFIQVVEDITGNTQYDNYNIALKK